jgi:hypothetical protein
MEDITLKNLQKYLEYIRCNTTDFGLRLLKPFVVCKYYLNKTKYQAIFSENNDGDCYWVTNEELNSFIAGKYSNKVNLVMNKPFKEGDTSGFYISLSLNNLEPTMENIQKLFGLRFKRNDIFYKITDVAFQQLSMPYDEPNEIKDNVKIFTIEDFHVDDFLEVNKFVDSGRTVKRGMGYSIEIDEEHNNEYVSITDARTAIKMAKEAAKKEVLEELNLIFHDGHAVGDHVKDILNRKLS